MNKARRIAELEAETRQLRAEIARLKKRYVPKDETPVFEVELPDGRTVLRLARGRMVGTLLTFP